MPGKHGDDRIGMGARLRTAAFAAALIAAPALAPAQPGDQPVELRFSYWVPPTHLLAKTGFEPWARSLEAASDGSIKVSFFPAQQLGKAADHYDMARDGIVDLAFVNPGYQTGRFPIIAASELPFLVSAPGPGSVALDAWYRRYAEREMSDVKYCLAHLHVGTLHSKHPIRTPEQVRGLKVRPANGTVAQMISLLGGTNVQVSAPEARDALDKGIADAITFPWNSVITFGMDKAVRHHTDFRLYAASFTWVVNKRWYARLSPNQKRVFDDHCSNAWAGRAGAPWADEEDAGETRLRSAGGHTMVRVSDDELAAWRKAVEPLTVSWMQSVDRLGVDGRKAFDELKSELRAHGALFGEGARP